MNRKLIAVLGIVFLGTTAVAGFQLLLMPAGLVADDQAARDYAARAELTAKQQAKITVLEAELRKAREATESAGDDERRKIALLQADLAKANEELRLVKQDKSKTTAAIDLILTHGGREVDEIRVRQEELETDRAQLRDMQLKILELTGNLSGLAGSLAEARNHADDLRAENQRLKQAAAGKSFPEDLKLNGVVTNATREVLVEIALGSDDGVRRGTIFDVLRDGKSRGRIQILQASPHAAVGREMAEFKQADIEKNDRVANRPD